MSVAEETPLRCPVRRKDGQPCSAKVTGSGYCVAHDPRSNAWRAMGGRASGNSERAIKLLPSRLAPLVDKLEQVFNALYLGATEERVAEARAMATIAVAISKLIAVGELEERTRELERMAAEAQKERQRGGSWWGGNARTPASITPLVRTPEQMTKASGASAAKDAPTPAERRDEPAPVTQERPHKEQAGRQAHRSDA